MTGEDRDVAPEAIEIRQNRLALVLDGFGVIAPVVVPELDQRPPLAEKRPVTGLARLDQDGAAETLTLEPVRGFLAGRDQSRLAARKEQLGHTPSSGTALGRSPLEWPCAGQGMRYLG